MKKIVAIALLACNVCFSNPFFDSGIEPVIPNHEGFKVKFNNSKEKQQEIQFYKKLVFEEDLPKIYKIHYLVELARIYHYSGRSQKEKETIGIIKFLCMIDEECIKEFNRYYYFSEL